MRARRSGFFILFLFYFILFYFILFLNQKFEKENQNEL